MKNYTIRKIPAEKRYGMEGRIDVLRHEVRKNSCMLRIKEGLAGLGTGCEE